MDKMARLKAAAYGGIIATNGIYLWLVKKQRDEVMGLLEEREEHLALMKEASRTISVLQSVMPKELASYAVQQVDFQRWAESLSDVSPREKNTGLYEIKNLSTQGAIMAENQTETPQPLEAVVVEEQKSSRLKSFAAKHPRAMRVAGITAAVATVAGVVAAVKNHKTENDNALALASGNEQVLELNPTTETVQVKEA